MKSKPVRYVWRAIRRFTVNRKYKDHLFRIIFQDKKDLLELYNAVTRAVDECIRDDILADILRRNRAEVVDLFLTTYDAKLHKKAIEEEAREDGMAQGMEQGMAKERTNSYRVLAESCCELGCTKELAIQKLIEKYALSDEEATEIIEKIWKN